MPSILELLRLKRLAGIDPFAANIRERVKFPVTPTQPSTEIETPLAPSPIAPINSLDTLSSSQRARPTPRIKEYMSYLENEPQRKDYQAGKISKLLAAVSGTIEGAFDSPSKGISTYKGITDMPYIEAMEQYDRKGGRLKEMADLEYRGLTDEDKRIIQLEELRLKQAESARQWIELESGLGLKKAQVENIMNQIKNRGLIVEDNEVTGEKEVVDKINGTRISLGKFAVSEKDKRAEARSMFSYQSGVTEGRMGRLQEDAQSHARFMEGLRTSNDKDLIKYREDLSNAGILPTQQNAAFEGSYEEILTEFPDLREMLFDAEGNLKEDRNPQVHKMFVNALRERTNKKLGITTPPRKVTGGTVTIPKGEIEVIAPDGTPGTIPASQWEEAKAAGYRKK